MNAAAPAPWQVPGYGRPHHCLPLPGGCWRGPAPASADDHRVLHNAGVEYVAQRADGSAAYRLPAAGPAPWWVHGFVPGHAGSEGVPRAAGAAEADRARGAILDPQRERGAWILARLAAAWHAHRAAPPQPQWMAILNLTPDSFSDGGRYYQGGELGHETLLASAEEHRAMGAAWLDLGAESTRPGAEDVPEEVQLQRLLPALETLAAVGLPLSVDTRSAAVADACLAAGATMVNDVSLLSDPHMAAVCAQHSAALVLMHSRGNPRSMAGLDHYTDLLGEVADEWVTAAARACTAGLDPEAILLDPGIGFAKNAQQSLSLLAQCGALRALGYPLLVGPSRKSFLGAALASAAPGARDCASAGVAASCALQGAAILRLHTGAYWDAVVAAAAIGRLGHCKPSASAAPA